MTDHRTTRQKQVPQTESDEEFTADVQELTACPECAGRIVRNGDQREPVCEDCGLVLGDKPIDRGPEWRAYNADERDRKSRVGAPTTELIHDKGLSTLIGWQNTDAYGNAIAARKRARIDRLRTWDERYRAKDAKERNIKQGFGEIRRMMSALGLSEPVGETAGILYRRAVEQNLLQGRSIEGMATASLYAAARQHGTPRPLAELATVSRVKKLRVQRAYRYLSRELALEIAPEGPEQYLPQFASTLELSDEAERMARELLDVATTNGIHSGKSPTSMAAGALYAAAQLTNEALTQETVSDVAHVSSVTIRNRYQELLEVYGNHQEF